MENSIEAAIVLSAVGSLKQAAIRFAGQSAPESVPGPLEILSLNGTVSAHGTHLHLAVSKSEGTCLGGHLLAGCPVNTTLEITLGIIPELQFDRTHDNETGFQELESRQSSK